MLFIKIIVLVVLAFYGYSMGQYSDLNSFGSFMVFVGFVAGFVLYFIPAIEAHRRSNEAFNQIMLLNLALGWTLIGWLAALLWAMKAKTPEATDAFLAENRVCPFCAETVKIQAKVCRHCQRDLPQEDMPSFVVRS